MIESVLTLAQETLIHKEFIVFVDYIIKEIDLKNIYLSLNLLAHTVSLMSNIKPILECCSHLDTCDYSNKEFLRDVFDPTYYNAPAISYIVMSILVIPLMIWSLRNIEIGRAHV